MGQGSAHRPHRRRGSRHRHQPGVEQGGGIQVDGTGRVVLTETVQLDRAATQAHYKGLEPEAELNRTMARPGAVAPPRPHPRPRWWRSRSSTSSRRSTPRPAHAPSDSANHPDHIIAQANRLAAEKYRDDTSASFEIIDLPRPPRSRTQRAGSTTATSTTSVIVGCAAVRSAAQLTTRRSACW